MKLANVLFERKKKMMKYNELGLNEYNEYDVFNLLHDLHQEVPLKEMRERNKHFYPRVKIGKAWATSNDSFILN